MALERESSEKAPESSAAVISIPKFKVKDNELNLLSEKRTDTGKQMRKTWFKDLEAIKREETTHLKTDEPTILPNSNTGQENLDSRPGLHLSKEGRKSLTSPSEAFFVGASADTNPGKEAVPFPTKLTEVSSFRILKKKPVRLHSLYQSYHERTSQPDLAGASIHKAASIFQTQDNFYQSSHRRNQSDILAAKGKLDSFLRTDAFKGVYKDDTYRLLKIHHKLLI